MVSVVSIHYSLVRFSLKTGLMDSTETIKSPYNYLQNINSLAQQDLKLN